MEPRFYVFEIDLHGVGKVPTLSDPQSQFSDTGYDEPDDAEDAIRRHGQPGKQYTILPVLTPDGRG